MRKQAHDKSKLVRRARAEIKDALAFDAMTLDDVFARSDDGDRICGGLRVRGMLRALPGVSYKGSDKLMAEIGICMTQTVRGLGPRQRQVLLNMFS